MGASESRYRITKTENIGPPWVGLSTVVTINEMKDKLVMPNGEKHKFIFINNKGLRILEGKHKGYYDVQVIY